MDEKTSRSSLGKILFKNGFFDMRANVFSFSFNPKIVFLARIPFHYEPFQYSDRQYMEDLKNRYFTLPLGKEVGDFFLLNLSPGFAGDVIKRFFFGLGPTNSGKSTLSKHVSLLLDSMLAFLMLNQLHIVTHEQTKQQYCVGYYYCKRNVLFFRMKLKLTLN